MSRLASPFVAKFLVPTAVAVSLALGCAGAAAQPSQLIPLEDLARGPRFYVPAVSPDGARIAYIGVTAGRGAIWIMDGDGGDATLVYRDPNSSIDNVEWSPDGKWLLFLKDTGGNEVTHLYRLNPLHPGPPIDLTPVKNAAVELVNLPKRSTGTAVITMGARNPQTPDVYRVDLPTGRIRRLLINNGMTEFYSDELGRIRAAQKIRKSGTLEVVVPRGSSWVPIYSAPPAERLTVLGLSPDGTKLIIRSNRNRPTEQLLSLSLSTRTVRPLVPHKCGRFDAEEAYWDPLTSAVLAVSCTTDKADLVPIERSAANAIAEVERLTGAKGGISLVSQAIQTNAAVYSVGASDFPTRYVFYAYGHATFLPDPRPWISNYKWAKSEFQFIAARDGLPIPIYVTRTAAPGPQPTIVLLHGGPWDRDRGAFDPEVQQLVNRGFSVLQVNYRGSTGFGRKHWEGGVGQFGRAMSDDVMDALSWAIGSGITDPSRVCIMGGSYGGYATLVAMTRDSDRFRCGVDFAGPSELVTLVQAFPPVWKPYLPRSWYRFVGNPASERQREAMIAASPVYHADQIKAALLIFQGANDPRVPKTQSDSIVASARKRGLPVVYLVAANEGHSFGEEQTNLAVKRAVELFLAKYAGGAAQPTIDPQVQRTLDSFLAAGQTSPNTLH